MLFSFLNGDISQEEYLRQNNVTLWFKRMPGYIYGFIFKYQDKILITINDQISEKKKRFTLLHELAHLELKHTECNFLEFKLKDIEDEADNYTKYLINMAKIC